MSRLNDDPSSDIICTDLEAGTGGRRETTTGGGDVSIEYPVNSVLSASVRGVSAVRHKGHATLHCLASSRHLTWN